MSERGSGLLCLAVAVVASCGGAERALPVPTDAHARAEAIAELRFRIASQPGDLGAHLALARLELAAERPGAALRHFEIADRHGALTPTDAQALARLLADCGASRVARGDGEAFRDLDAARRLDTTLALPDSLVVEARFLAALAGLRRGNRWGDQQAADAFDRAAELAPGDLRLALRRGNKAGPGPLGNAALWLYRGGALRAARDAFVRARAMTTPGTDRDPAILRAWLAVHMWWGDDDDDTSLALRRDLEAAGVSACSLAWPREHPLPPWAAPGCRGTLWAVATGDREHLQLVIERAVADDWPALPARDAAAWALIALRGSLSGAGSFATLLTGRVEVATVAATPDLDPAVRPLFTRLAGHTGEAARALDRALASAFGPGQEKNQSTQPAMSEPGAILLLAAEAAFTGRSAEVVAGLALRVIGQAQRPAGGLDPADALLPGALLDLCADAYLVTALYAGHDHDPARVRQDKILADAPNALARQRYHQRSPAAMLASAPRADILALAVIAENHLFDPTLADRAASDFVDGDVDIGRRGPLVATLFAILGDPARARLWWERVVALAPGHAPFVFELARAVASAGDPTRARVHFTTAAALSGDAGSTAMRGARVLLAAGSPIDAIILARQALPLVAPVRRRPVYRLLSDAMGAAGRTEEARAMAKAAGPEKTFARPDGKPDLAASGMDATDAGDTGDAEAALARVHAGLSTEAARAVLLPALVWNPDDERLLGALARTVSPDSQDWQRAVVGLFVLALVPMWEGTDADDGGLARVARIERAWRASQILAEILARRDGDPVRRLLRSLRRGLGGPSSR